MTAVVIFLTALAVVLGAFAYIAAKYRCPPQTARPCRPSRRGTSPTTNPKDT
ncbi:MAG: hypothetical protein ACXVX9_04725 [Mycobacteriaceae bacterium]